MSRAANLGPDWRRDADGVAFRDAARVLLFDDRGRVLLVRGHDADQPERTWWFTIGGGIEPGEGERAAAVRELHEEAGLALAEVDLEGPVLTRSAQFDFFAETVRQDEVFFLARIDSAASLSTAGWTAVERRFMDELAWWHPGDLARLNVEVFPHSLPEITAALSAGWDGQIRHLGFQDDQARRA